MEELSLHILDLAQNSLAAGATQLEVAIVEDLAGNRLTIEVSDNGSGMSEEQCRAALDPFVTSRRTRNVGLGLPLLKLAAEQAGGGLWIDSRPGAGTRVRVEFQHDHLDRVPLGDMSSTLVSILALNEDCRLRYRHQRGERQFSLDSEQLKTILGPVPFGNPQVAVWLGQYVKENEQSLEVLEP
ncbi:MAG: ATP-binding protein [Bacillota bacterium]|jgi:hypothetical protein